MESQKDLIYLKDWDCLVILDACRYDFFQNNYRDFLEGSLRKVNSNAVHTGEWLKNTFDNYGRDVAYISATPCVNSLGVSLEKTNPYWGIDWTATEHFSKIIDVWDFGWSERLETVPPRPSPRHP